MSTEYKKIETTHEENPKKLGRGLEKKTQVSFYTHYTSQIFRAIQGSFFLICGSEE